MAATNPKVMSMIEAELKKDPSISNEALLAKAKKIDRSVGKLSARQFNARYPLQVKRRKDGPKAKASAKGGRPAKKKARAAKAKAPPAPKKAGRPRKKRAASSAPAARSAAGSGGGNREAVRKVLLDYARKVASADSKTDIVDLVIDVDRYVDRVMKATG